jgi:hypothetical protein
MAEMNLPTNIKLSCLLIFYRFFIQQYQFLIAQKYNSYRSEMVQLTKRRSIFFGLAPGLAHKDERVL